MTHLFPVPEAFGIEQMLYQEGNVRGARALIIEATRLEELHQPRESLYLLEEALDSDPISALRKMAGIYSSSDSEILNVLALERLSNLDPGDASSHLNLAISYQQIGEIEKDPDYYSMAVDELNEALRTDNAADDYDSYQLRKEVKRLLIEGIIPYANSTDNQKLGDAAYACLEQACPDDLGGDKLRDLTEDYILFARATGIPFVPPNHLDFLKRWQTKKGVLQ